MCVAILLAFSGGKLTQSSVCSCSLSSLHVLPFSRHISAPLLSCPELNFAVWSPIYLPLESGFSSVFQGKIKKRMCDNHRSLELLGNSNLQLLSFQWIKTQKISDKNFQKKYCPILLHDTFLKFWEEATCQWATACHRKKSNSWIHIKGLFSRLVANLIWQVASS